MNKLVIASAFTLAAFSASAQLYGEIGVTSIKIEEATPGLNLESSPAAIRGVLGYEINPNLAVEGLVNRPGFELTPKSWTNLKGLHEEVRNRVQAQGGQELFGWGRRS